MSGNTMNEWLAAARDDVARHGPDPMVETQLASRVRERAALRSMTTTRPGKAARRVAPNWLRWSFVVPGAVAALLVVLLGTRVLAPLGGSSVPAHEIATPFIALVAGEALAAERAPVVVPSQVPRAALADYGLPVDPARADETVGAEFLVSRSGVVLAVRFKE